MRGKEKEKRGKTLRVDSTNEVSDERGVRRLDGLHDLSLVSSLFFLTQEEEEETLLPSRVDHK